ncbi:hypothetical protein V8B97DRAFT_1942339 [Scleroderma yunnanense]
MDTSRKVPSNDATVLFECFSVETEANIHPPEDTDVRLSPEVLTFLENEAIVRSNFQSGFPCSFQHILPPS